LLPFRLLLEQRGDAADGDAAVLDAVGSDIDNLSLSDRRAQSVASVLTQNFQVPPENLTTQGYGPADYP
jgi:hypothetical protein